MGTGDPNIPPDVSEAKAIRTLIIEKTEGVTGSEEEPFAMEEDNEDGDDGEEEEEDVPAVEGDPSELSCKFRFWLLSQKHSNQ
jgi:hypothetical protein